MLQHVHARGGQRVVLGFDELAAVARRHGILLVADEVQSGMGRTGSMFASEHFDFAPDILATAKGIASGMPLSATIARAEVMNWKPGAHASTFGGNPVSIAASLATIELFEESLIAHAARIGAHIRARMDSWPSRFPQVVQVRGLGLMIGVELNSAALRNRLVSEASERGLLVLGCGEASIRICPPLIIRGTSEFLCGYSGGPLGRRVIVY